jgi:DUF4097 and DUF4098 domain-containing protein YvlB
MLLASTAFAAAAIDHDEERTFTVRPGCMVKADLYRGSIDVQESDVDEITVIAHTSVAATLEKPGQLRAALGLEIRQEGNTVFVRAIDPSGRGLKFTRNDKPPVDLDCKILVPRRCDVDLRTRDGGVTVGNLTGHVIVRAARGNLFLRRIDGSADVATQEGDVIISRCSGQLLAKTGHGTIRVGTLGGRAVLKNSGGDIEVLEAYAGLDVMADAGDVIVGLPNPLAGETTIRTAYGSIFAKIDPAANCAVRASSFWGHVENKLPLAIESGGNGKGKLAGRLNEGGPLVTLHANGGHVFLQRGDTYFD